MSLTLYIAFDKTIIKSIFQPLKKYFKSIFSATNELYVHIGQDSQCYIKTVSSTSLARSLLQPLTLLRWAAEVPSILRSIPSCAQLRLVRVLPSLSKAFPNSLSFPATSLIILQINVSMLWPLGQQTREWPVCLFQPVFLYGSYDPS